MSPPLNGPLPNLGYLRLLEYQKQRKVYQTYSVDSPLLLFIFFSRIAAGLSILSVFFPPSLLWMITAFCCMVLATAASITHLTIPSRFLAMIINHRSPIVWEIRLAGALTGSLGAQLVSRLGILPGFETLLLWSSFCLSILFLIATGWAYRFHTHPAWKTDILPGYYLASASMIGFALYSMIYPKPFWGSSSLLSSALRGF
jgi:DMSO reductase anchor subunit